MSQYYMARARGTVYTRNLCLISFGLITQSSVALSLSYHTSIQYDTVILNGRMVGSPKNWTHWSPDPLEMDGVDDS